MTSRYATDINDVILPGYSTMDVDVRFNLKQWGLDKTFIQLNVSNLFDRQYLGSIGSQIASSTNIAGQVTNIATTANIPGGGTPTFTPASPRAFTVSVQVGF